MSPRITRLIVTVPDLNCRKKGTNKWVTDEALGVQVLPLPCTVPKSHDAAVMNTNMYLAIAFVISELPMDSAS